MSDISDSELFSAYLDGELTAEEQIRAEQVLATSAEARQLLEELRALSGTLQSLPQEKLGEDLSARVLQIAERRMLAPDESDNTEDKNKPSAGRAAASMTTPKDESSESEGFPWREISWRGMFSPRALIWSAIVIVVAIIIHFKVPQDANRELAVANKKAAPAPVAANVEKPHKPSREAAWVGPADAAKKPGGGELAAGNEFRARELQPKRDLTDEKAAGDGVELDRSAARDGEHFEKALARKESQLAAAKEGVRTELAKGELAREPSKAGPVPPAAAPATKSALEPALGAAAPAAANKAAASREESDVKGLALRDGRSQPKSGKGADEAGDGEHLSRAAHGLGGSRSFAAKSGSQPVDAVAGSGPAPTAPMAAPPAAPAPVVMSVAPLKSKAGAGEVPLADQPAGQPVTLVRLNVSAAAVENGLFDKLLARNGLAATTGQSQARLANAKADNGSLRVGGVQVPMGGTASAGSVARQQQIAPQAAPEANLAPQEIVQNSVSRPASQAFNNRPAPVTGPLGAASPAASNLNYNGTVMNGGTVVNGGALTTPADNNSYGSGAMQAIVAPNQADNFRQGQAQSAITSNLAGGVAGMSPSISYEVDASPAQLDALLAQINQQRDAFSAPEVTPPPAPMQKFGEGVRGKRASGDYYQYHDQPAAVADGKPAKDIRAEQSQAKAEPREADKLGEEEAKRQQREVAGGKAPAQRAMARRSAVAAAKTHIVFMLNVVDRVTPLPAAATSPPAAAAPASAPARGK